jgi:flavin-dependent dehydrogenase
VIRCVADPPGYIWSFPRAVIWPSGFARRRTRRRRSSGSAHARAWIDASGLARGATLEPYSWPILSARQISRDRLAGDRWCLAGDAAGLVDPITREGIFFALKSADLAADALVADGGRAGYAQSIAREVHPELRRAASLKAGFFRPRFTDLLLHGLRESAGIRGCWPISSPAARRITGCRAG